MLHLPFFLAKLQIIKIQLKILPKFFFFFVNNLFPSAHNLKLKFIHFFHSLLLLTVCVKNKRIKDLVYLVV